MIGLGTTALECRNAFAAGDMAFYNANSCGNMQTTELIAAKKKELTIKTILIIAGGAVALGAVYYFTSKHKVK